LLSAEEHVLDRAFGEPRRRSDTASDSAAVCPHAPTPAVMLGIDPSMVGATPRHHEPDASDRVNLPLPLQPPASAGRLWLLKGTDGPAWRLRWLGHRGAIRPSDRYRTRCGGTGRWLVTVAACCPAVDRHGCPPSGDRGLPMAPPRVGLYRLAHKRSDAGPRQSRDCPVRTTDVLAPVAGSRQLACGVARARQETNSDISLLCRGPGSAQPPTWMSARNQLPRHPATRHQPDPEQCRPFIVPLGRHSRSSSAASGPVPCSRYCRSPLLQNGRPWTRHARQRQSQVCGVHGRASSRLGQQVHLQPLPNILNWQLSL
jgi:hypothetical protein